ncbi:Signal transduction histidine kinase [Glycomyces harbinensis]|uniref:histidine kinase n=1 Tax=Glycomyces harbinensis TaxID=58114 RepID=A0A1G6Y9N5_9ACTN|nr:Signal transduction histidine kinase [Glycomyces harbinensis]
MRALWAGETWRSLMHLVTGSLIGALGGILIGVLLVPAFAAFLTVVVPVLVLGAILLVSSVLTVVQRSRHSAYLGVRWPDTSFTKPAAFELRAVLDFLRNPRTWRQFAYHVISGVYGPLAGFFAVAAWTFGPAMLFSPLFGATTTGLSPRHWILFALGVIVTFGAPWITRLFSWVDELMARQLLGTNRVEELQTRVTDLAASRDSTVDAADAERRRIERDLHDGAQQRLTSLAMNLGIARATLTDLPEDASRALAQAHEESKQVLTDLRDLVRGLHPAVLEDRGLDAALSAVAARSPVPVRVKVDMDRRAPRDVEGVAYFVVSEALTNAARHSDAQHAAVEVQLDGERLRLKVTDDGRGGADPEAGTGLKGLADRVRSVDGTFHLTSPLGGPTTIEAELPCAS